MRYFIVLVVVLIASLNLRGQDFLIEEPVLVKGSTVDYEVKVKTTIRNTTGDFLHLQWDRLENVPEGWKTLVCDPQTCWTPEFSSSEFVLSPNQKAVLYISFMPDGKSGEGSVSLRVNGQGKKTAAAKVVTFNVLVEGDDVSKSMALKQLKVLPEPTVSYFSLSHVEGVKVVEVYNLLGNIVKRFAVERKDEKYFIRELPKGLYFVSMLDESGLVMKTVRMNKM